MMDVAPLDTAWLDESYVTQWVVPASARNYYAGATGVRDDLLEGMYLTTLLQTGSSAVTYVVDSAVDGQVVDQLKSIKRNFGMNMSQLAAIIGISRPQLYKWYSGSAIPARENSNRKIALFANLADELPHSHLSLLGKLTNRYVSEERTLLDVLSDDLLTRENFMGVYGSLETQLDSLAQKTLSLS